MATKKKPDVIVEDGTAYVLRSGTPIYIKTADVCSIIGKSNQWVGQLISQGTISKESTPHGAMFNLKETIRAYCNMLDSRARPAEDQAQIAAEKERTNAEIGIKKARAVKFTLEATELQGRMHRSEDVAHMTEDLIYSIRGMLMALPGRLAIDAANLTDPAEVSELIRKEVYGLMEELSRYKYDSKKYEERVRQRMNWGDNDFMENDDEDI